VNSVNSVLLVPLGSLEQHGPHLPLDTDTVIANEFALRAAAIVADTTTVEIVVAPALAYGSSGEHQHFAGTISIGQEALELVLVELVRSATATFRRVVLVNGHGGNHEPVARAVARLREEGRDVRAWAPRIAGGDAHAGRTETSLLLAIDPRMVRSDRLEPGNVRPLAELLAPMLAGGVRAVAPNGVLGDPTGANADEGSQILQALVDSLVDSVLDAISGGSGADHSGVDDLPARQP
jgi:creatinine amidohydrolase